jgi:hypothetical protein
MFIYVGLVDSLDSAGEKRIKINIVCHFRKENTMKSKRYRIEVSEEQLRMIINCVEDCHRFMGGQMELQNTTSALREIKPLVTPRLSYNASYDWAGSGCPNENQKKFLQASYYLYRELLHQWTLMQDADDWNVYKSPTLRCEGSGEVIKLEEV